MEDPSSQSIEVAVQADSWIEAVTDIRQFCGRIADAALQNLQECVRCRVELGLHLTDDQAVHALNLEWRGKDMPTNVLSFPGIAPDEAWPEDGPVLLGDIVIAFETVELEALDAGISVEAHLAHMIVHGVLHLIGYDHVDEEDARAMEALETRVMAKLGYKDPYAGSDFSEEQAGMEAG